MCEYCVSVCALAQDCTPLVIEPSEKCQGTQGFAQSGKFWRSEHVRAAAPAPPPAGARERERGETSVAARSACGLRAHWRYSRPVARSTSEQVRSCNRSDNNKPVTPTTTSQMAPSNNSFASIYHRLFVELADPRTNDWFLIRDPWPGLAVIGLYLYFCLSWGPRFMERREPLQLQKTLIVYNFLQVLVSCWLFHEGLDAGWATTYSWKCQPVDFSNTPEALRVARGVYVYFLAKMSELLDTVFFVIRKKNQQVTFLHMYHHTVMPMISWGVTKYYPGGHGTFIGVINSFVHIVMYTYYMLAAMGPQLQKYLAWKKYITTLQMLQFCLAFLHSSQLLFYDCGYPRWSVFFTLPNAIFFYYLFDDFYVKAYRKSVSREEKQKNGSVSNGIGKAVISNGFKIENKNENDNNKKTH
ncbi:Elongation of very long chain fatty acids protein AAEL008004 [Eumeta japonica]|uniref:Elongation of very long chain fatty acids protein n=1 Tax=Eumeta variegata TaxID=151549 RepID=A0A4C1ZA37_EUMVA|nr:Elongation of very long chain fatty acids protein AAEL008004 [Eumeta japonica]